VKRIHLLFLAAVLVATFTVLNISSFRVAAQPPRPNIVVIMTDDQDIVPE
jgi:hypothetical protein